MGASILDPSLALKRCRRNILGALKLLPTRYRGSVMLSAKPVFKAKFIRASLREESVSLRPSGRLTYVLLQRDF